MSRTSQMRTTHPGNSAVLLDSWYRILLACMLTSLSPGGACADDLPRIVLILDQSGPGLTAYAEIVSSFRSSLVVPAEPALTVYHEKLDLNIFGGPAYQGILATFI